MTNTQWEIEVTRHIEDLLECTTSDAQGIIEANEFRLSQAWGKDLEPLEAANYLLND